MNEQELRNWLNPANQQLLTELEGIIPVRFTLWERNYHGCQVHKAENDMSYQSATKVRQIV